MMRRFLKNLVVMPKVRGGLVLLGALWLVGCGRSFRGQALTCGDGVCQGDETCQNCPGDCGACNGTCGDGFCSADETCESCTDDCGACTGCGDGFCVGDETCETCTDDCGVCTGCGDGFCVGDETCDTCPDDCGACAVCGDGVCEDAKGETPATCPEDCEGPVTCGDGICTDPAEDCQNCPDDCGACTGCGDGTCADDEDCTSCPQDCGQCPSFCGDGYCDHDEDCNSCSEDCGECPQSCGDGQCQPLGGETCANCPSDCTCGTDTCQDVLNCTSGCNMDQSCMNTCAEDGCYEAQVQASALFACMLANCVTECQNPQDQGCMQCIMTNCSAEAMACYNGTCGPAHCGDGQCQPEEDCTNCPDDCGQCPDQCGDGYCQAYEDCNTCPQDCGPCAWCGDGYCDKNEDCNSCADDCGKCALTCGDGQCEQLLGESCAVCPQDCECGGDTCAVVLQCMTNCSTIICPNDCLSSGCYEAQQEGHAVLQCMISNCLMQCISPNNPQCQQCLMNSCSAELMACITGTCS